MLTVLQGDCRDVLKTLPDESVHCCTTSPPYWGLRDYGVDGQLGLESSPEAYVASLVGILREVRRVLQNDGTLWLNLGDSYAGSWGNYHPNSPPGKHGQRKKETERFDRSGYASQEFLPPTANFKSEICKPKDLCGIPWLVAFALRADGWYLRSEIIWHKPNPMPESVTDRPTKSHEQIFLLTKSARYFYDAEAIKERSIADHPSGNGYKRSPRLSYQNGDGSPRGNDEQWTDIGGSRNRRSVWTIPTSPYSDAHFATFPPKLIEPCILAGTSARGCCAECGAPWERVLEQDGSYQAHWAPRTQSKQSALGDGRTSSGGVMETGFVKTYATTGWQPTCEHEGEPVPCTVLDPFAGSGTTGKVALELGRKAILIELNPKYCDLIERRAEVTLGLPGLA